MTTKATNKLKQITTAEIIDAVEATATIEQAREVLKTAPGAMFRIRAKIEKLVKRANQLKFIITDETDARRTMTIHADMSADKKNVALGKYRKGKLADIAGKLQSFGYNGICITKCRILAQPVN